MTSNILQDIHGAEDAELGGDGPNAFSSPDPSFMFLRFQLLKLFHDPPFRSPAFSITRKRFGHVARSDVGLDHQHALGAAMEILPASWGSPIGRLRHTHDPVSTAESGLRPTTVDLLELKTVRSGKHLSRQQSPSMGLLIMMIMMMMMTIMVAVFP